MVAVVAVVVAVETLEVVLQVAINLVVAKRDLVVPAVAVVLARVALVAHVAAVEWRVKNAQATTNNFQ